MPTKPTAKRKPRPVSELYDYELTMSILKCKNCGSLALSFDDESGGQRITGHKCSGAWDTLQEFTDVAFDQADIDAYNRVKERRPRNAKS